MSDTKEYSLGFAFDSDKQAVVLIRKNKPEWQAGLLNGVGGKIEPGESPLDAVVREFKEETGVDTDPEDWRNFCLIRGEGWKVFCYAIQSDEAYQKAVTIEAEWVVKHYISELDESECISNIGWLLRLATEERCPVAVVDY